MSLAKRSDGRWVVKYKDTGGRWKQRSFRSEAEARQFDAECQYDQAESQRLTLLECVLVYLKNNQYCTRTVGVYEFLVCGNDRQDGTHREGPAEILATKYADSLTRLDLESVRENCRRDGMSITTINLYVSKINAALNWCVQQDLLTENPWLRYKRLPGAKPKSRMGTLDDFSKIFSMLPPWMQWVAKTTIALCLRPGESELFSLEWSSFNWKNQSVSVAMGKTGTTKVVFLPAPYFNEAKQRYQEDKQKGLRFVCRDRRDRRINGQTCRDAWYRACRHAGVKMPMYAMRHIAASEMLANGADLAAVAAQLGHRTIATTAGFYTHAIASAQRRAAHALPDCTILVQVGAEKQP